MEKVKIRSKQEIVDDIIKQTEEAILVSEIMMAFEQSNPWKLDTIEKKAKAKMEHDKMVLKQQQNQKFLDDFAPWAKKYLAKENEK